MINILKRTVPRRAHTRLFKFRSQLRLYKEYRADRARYGRNCLPGEIVCDAHTGAKNLEAQLTKDYHRVEKGLALPQPKRPFGSIVSARLQANISLGKSASDVASTALLAESAHEALRAWNERGFITEEVAPAARSAGCGLNHADQFFRSRHSVRDFDTTEVYDSTLAHAVDLAICSPSVCNRQAWQVRFFRGDAVARVLAHQNGNSGFTHVVPVVALVTVDTRLFSGPGERNQPWIEGGIFSMSFVWALHALGLASCMLNMSLTNSRVDSLRNEFGIDDCELVIMMIAIGHARRGHRIARSPRRSIDEVVISQEQKWVPYVTRGDDE